MTPKIITAEVGGYIEQTRSPVGLFYYPDTRPDGKRLIWVGIINQPEGFRRMRFDTFGECIEWLLGSVKNNEKGGE